MTPKTRNRKGVEMGAMVFPTWTCGPEYLMIIGMKRPYIPTSEKENIEMRKIKYNCERYEKFEKRKRIRYENNMIG